MFDIQANAKPTADDVKKLLDEGKLTLTKNTFSIEDIAAQVMQTHAVVQRYAGVIDQQAGTKMTEKVVMAHRLLEIGGYLGAEKVTLTAEQVGKTTAQAALRKSLVSSRDAVVRLARDKAVDTRLFSVNFGSGDATNTLPAAYVFENLLKKHAPKLGDSPLIKELVKEVERDVAALSKTEVEQEEKKREATIPGSLRAKARHACYEILLHISRTGFAVFRKDEEIREQFRLAVLHKTSASVVVPDDDDTPITTAPNEEFATTVAATTTGDVPRA